MNALEKQIAELRKTAQCRPSKPKEYECAKCRDTGWIEVEQDGYTAMRKCDCWAVREARRLMEQSGISLEFQNKRFDNFNTRNNPQLVNAKNKAMAYCKSFGEIEGTRYNSIMFCGQVGSGKTHLGTAICSTLINRNVAVIYMAYRNAVTKIKQLLTDESAYAGELSKYSRARVLYIDDMLKGRITESDVNIMYEIVNYRYMNNLPLIISTEKTLDELLGFDEAIGSRMIEMCRGNIIRLQGKELNYRLYSPPGGAP